MINLNQFQIMITSATSVFFKKRLKARLKKKKIKTVNVFVLQQHISYLPDFLLNSINTTWNVMLRWSQFLKYDLFCLFKVTLN